MTKLYSGSTGKGNGGVSTATSPYLNQAPRTVAEVEAEMGLRPKRTADYRAYLTAMRKEIVDHLAYAPSDRPFYAASLARIETCLADLGEEG